jgi:hypothetical protein
MTGREKQLTRIERAERCYAAARDEIWYVRQLRTALAKQGQTLGKYLPEQAVAIARHYTRVGRLLQYTNKRVQLIPSLRCW